MTVTAARVIADWRFRCISCDQPLEVLDGVATCAGCGRNYERWAGIWRCLPLEREMMVTRFTHEYGTVRAREGWGSADPTYYRRLPLAPRDDPHHAIWRMRAISYRTLLDRVVAPLEERGHRQLRILDLGAGCGWLAHRLAERGHLAAAIDLQTDARDGLGAWVHYETSFLRVQALFENLPFADSQADLAVFNASLHYAPDIFHPLAEALRVLRPGGVIAVLDTPLYRRRQSGLAMVREREARFQQEYGFTSRALASEGFLTEERIAGLARELGLSWQRYAPFYGWRRAARPLMARLCGRREPSRFQILVAERPPIRPRPGESRT